MDTKKINFDHSEKFKVNFIRVGNGKIERVFFLGQVGSAIAYDFYNNVLCGIAIDGNGFMGIGSCTPE